MRHLRLLRIVLLGILFLSTSTATDISLSSFAAQAQTENKETKVWLNTSSGVYHCPGTRWYGNTKHGKYINECEAISNGNRPAYGRACDSQCPSGLTPTTPPPSAPSTENTSPAPKQTGNPDARVWVNTNSGVYHCPGTRWYGGTKHGEFMTQRKAQESGNRPAYGKVCP